MMADPTSMCGSTISRENRHPQHHVQEVIQGLVVGAVQADFPTPGVVDQEVDSTPLVGGGLDNARGSVVVGQNRLPPSRLGRDRCGRLVESLHIPPGGEHGHAGFGQLGRRIGIRTTAGAAPVTIAICMSSVHCCQGRLDLGASAPCPRGCAAGRSKVDDLLWRFEDRDTPGLQEGAEIGHVGPRVGGRDDHRAGTLAGAWLGQADDGDVGDLGVANQVSSISLGEMFSPLRMIRSLTRPVTTR